MKLSQFLLLALLLVILDSCRTIGYGYQIVETKAIRNGLDSYDLEFVSDSVTVIYDFWSEGGRMNMSIVNHSNQIISLDLQNSFFIRNGVSKSYYSPGSVSFGYSSEMENTQIESNTVVSEPLGFSYADMNSGSTREKVEFSFETVKVNTAVLRIAPHAYINLHGYQILNQVLDPCIIYDEDEMNDTAWVDYTKEESPVHFSNYLTIRGEDGQPMLTTTHSFYVKRTKFTSVSNYEEESRVDECGKPLNEEQRSRIIYTREDGQYFYNLVIVE